MRAQVLAMGLLLTVCGCALVPPPAEEASNSVVRVYDVRDLLTPVTDYGAGPAAGPATAPSASEMAAQIAAAVRLVAPEASVRAGEANLVVVARPQAHAKIAAVLDGARRERSAVITIETRFMTVSRSLVESLDEDLREAIAAASVMGVDGRVAGPPVLAAPAVNRLLRATQSGPGATMLTAPRITLFNGQWGSVEISTQKEYVADYARDAAGALRPVTQPAEEGVGLRARATASADRRQVALEIEPRVSVLHGFRKQAFQDAATTQRLETESAELETVKLRATAAVADGETVLMAAPMRAAGGGPQVVLVLATARVGE